MSLVLYHRDGNAIKTELRQCSSYLKRVFLVSGQALLENVLARGEIVNLALTQEPLKHLCQVWIEVDFTSCLLSLLPLIFNR